MKSFKQFLSESITINGDFNGTLTYGGSPAPEQTQESFFVQRARRMAELIISGTAASFSPDRQTLMELIHPAHMGRRFQVLWGVRAS